jgi:hypothetical protein
MKIDINAMLDHLSEVSIFDHSLLALFIILGMSAAFTLIHTAQEWKGRGGPLWWNFGAIVGIRVPWWLGFLFFFLILTVTQWLVALAAITGSLVICRVESKYAAVALGALIAARVADTLVSHVLPYVLGYRPNPGLSSTLLYIFEAGLMIATFLKGLTTGCGFTCLGVAIGALAFFIVLPLLWSLRIVKDWSKDRWRPGEPPPPWTGIHA